MKVILIDPTASEAIGQVPDQDKEKRFVGIALSIDEHKADPESEAIWDFLDHESSTGPGAPGVEEI